MKSKLQNKKLFLLDLDGTLYKGDSVFFPTKAFLESIKARGAKYLFITNNSSRGIVEYVKKLENMGLNVTKEDFYTSGSATIDYLKTYYPNKKVYLVGTKALAASFSDEGINLVSYNEAEVAVLSYDTELNYKKITELTTLLREKDIPYLATNPDYVCPVENGYLPDCGSFAEMVNHAVNKMPVIIGKPAKLFVETVLTRYELNKEDVVIVGDRLYTDLMAAINAEVDSVIVLTGEATLETIAEYKHKPTYVLNSIADIFN
ncbi:MAG TPA: HAD-IIA family hydrolase [Bacilli bacterium]|nr:HAD-IIA family hydrolase [Bacilli bacterium]